MYVLGVHCVQSKGRPGAGYLQTDALLCACACSHSDNKIGVDGARAAADALMVNSALQCVDLRGTHGEWAERAAFLVCSPAVCDELAPARIQATSLETAARVRWQMH